MTTLPQFINFEYRSKEEINGWPLIHINMGTNPETGQPLASAALNNDTNRQAFEDHQLIILQPDNEITLQAL